MTICSVFCNLAFKITVCNNMQHSASCFWCHTSVTPVLLSNTLKSPQEILIEPQQSSNRLLIIFQSACYERRINSGPVLLKDFHTAAEEEPDLLSDKPWLRVEGCRCLSQHFCVRLETIMTWMTGGWCLSLRDDGWGCVYLCWSEKWFWIWTQTDWSADSFHSSPGDRVIMQRVCV